MSLFEATILGIVQGLTEFIPVSSSGHLILARHVFGMQIANEPAFIFDVLVQMGTWVAVLIHYRRDLIAISADMLKGLRGQPAPQARLGWLILLATLPAIVVGWWLRHSMAGELSSLTATGLFLLATALLLVIAELFGRRNRDATELHVAGALWIGVFQALALFPAISRSAATLSGGMTRNLTRVQAARFAFLMAVPVMPGAATVALLDLGRLPEGDGLFAPLAIGFLVSAIVGYISIRWLLNYLSAHSLFPFAVYCIAVGAVAILLG
ncbi:MAG: undecaprenyl-diphosphate phosphatase [Anaerolineales bacterium]